MAKIAFRRLYEAGRVGYKRDANGKAIGLEWPDILPPMNWKIPGDPLGEVMQAPLSVDEERELKTPTWYSSLERFVEGKVRGSAPANQLLAMIKNGNLRPGELESTRILDWLGARGNSKVSRDEVLTELESRRVEVREVWKGAINPQTLKEAQRIERAIESWYDEHYSKRTTGTTDYARRSSRVG